MGNEETWESFLNLNLTSTSPYLLGLCFWSQSLRLLFPKMRIKPTLGLPGGSDGKESACNVGRPGFDPWVGKNPWRRAWQPTPVFLPGESHGGPWGRRVGHDWTTKHSTAEAYLGAWCVNKEGKYVKGQHCLSQLTFNLFCPPFLRSASTMGCGKQQKN